MDMTIQDSQADLQEMRAAYAALDRAQAIIEFGLDGIIIRANDNFLTLTGYRADEIVGRHHAMFVEKEYAASAEYARFWADLGAGKIERAEYKRLGKGGRELWINASYNPVVGADGRVSKVIKFATDITGQRVRNAEYIALAAAMSRAQAVVEFDMDGHLLSANENFLDLLEYELADV